MGLKNEWFNGRDLFLRAYRDDENITLIDSTPLLFMHLMLLFIPLVGFSWPALIVCACTYALRVFALTAGYHRYFSHRSYATSRPVQFLLAWCGASAAQMGPIWWAAHHRNHHLHSDEEDDPHSAQRRGFFWSHIGWLLCRKYGATDESRVKDLLRFPELRFVDRFHVIPAFALALVVAGIGWLLAVVKPEWGTGPWQMLIWGFFLSTVMVYHVTFCINSVTHMVGARRYETGDESRNSLLLALLTWGEGWHNNHHYYAASMRQGFFWWEVDITYYLLTVMSWFGLIWDVKKPPARVYAEARRGPAGAAGSNG